MITTDFFLARQPITDSSKLIFGFELLFRESDLNQIEIEDAFDVSCRLFVNVFDNFDISSILGDSLGFVNVDNKILFEDFIELVPYNKIILEIMETSAVNQELVDRVITLKRKGYKFALDNFVFDKDYINSFRPLFKEVSYIKINTQLTEFERMKMQLNILKKMNVKLIAEKVETYEEFKQYKQLGFDYFQGYYFSKPHALKAKSLDPSQFAVVKLLNMLNDSPDLRSIADIFKANPKLSYHLLRFANSANFSFRAKIKSIEHAVNLLGISKLKRWTMLIIYAANGPDSFKSPLFQTAIMRARFMELLSLHRYPNRSSTANSAYMIGMLSLFDVFFGVAKEQIISELSIDDSAKDALLAHKGFLGKLLRLAVESEQSGFIKNISKDTLDKLQINLKTVYNAKMRSYIWANDIINTNKRG